MGPLKLLIPRVVTVVFLLLASENVFALSSGARSIPDYSYQEPLFASALSDCTYPSLIDATSEKIVTGLGNRCFSSLDLVNVYVARIEQVNPTLHVVTEINPDAWDIAQQLDFERSIGKLRGPLHGLPVLMKANIGTRDRLETNAGSYALFGATLPEDSAVAAKLREAGLIILGKTSMEEWASCRSSKGDFWSAISGYIYAAYYPKQSPSGSSSGSGVATDLGLAWATLGTETAGSIIGPSDKSNIVGIKPTVGLTSRYLVIPISEHQDTVGPMARTVKDAARLLQVIAGPDSRDNYTSSSPFQHDLPDYLAACKESGLQGKRIGIARNVISEYSSKKTSYILPTFEHVISLLSEAGATIVDNTNFTAFSDYVNATGKGNALSDFVDDIAQYLSLLETNPQNIRNIEDLRTFTQNSPLEGYPLKDTELWDRAIAENLTNTSPEFWHNYQQNLYLGGEGGILGALERHNLDAVILPSYFASGIPALVGSPIISVPLGAASEDTEVLYEDSSDAVAVAPGIPFGISFLGKKWSEETLIEIAYAFEQKSLVRRKLKRYIEPTKELD